MKDLYIYDLETISNYFLYVGYNVRTGEWKEFEWLNEDILPNMDFMLHLETEVSGQISFNGLGFDYPIIKKINDCRSPKYTANDIYNIAQDIINCQNSFNPKEKYKYYLKPEDIKIPQLDLFKLLHLDNKAKRLGLKDLEVFLRMKNVEDMPIHHSKKVTREEADLIKAYCKNDILATKKLYEFCKGKISLRRDLTKKYKTNLMSKSDSSIGSTILELEYMKKTKISKEDLKQIKGNKDLNFYLSDIISPKVNFKSKILQEFLDKLGKIHINKFEEESIIYKGLRSIIAKGGLHSDQPAEIYEESLNTSLIDLDFGSYYPGLMLSLELYPQQLGKEFLEVLKDLTDQRLAAKASKDMVTADSLKITINSLFGKLGNDFSFTQDMRVLYSVTINGQLFLLMLCEQLTNIAGVKCFYQNTDGASFQVPNEKREEFYKIANAFSEYLSIPVEFTDYKKCVIANVNNYLILTSQGKVKYKGSFLIDKEYYQNPSFRIVPIALSEYFVKGTPFEKTIKSHTDILDFCGRFKTTKGWHTEIRNVSFDKNENPFISVTKLQKTNRYFISNNGGAFYKVNEDGRQQLIEAGGRKVTIFNTIEEKNIKEYQIDINYYVLECEKIRRSIEKEQLQLF